MSLLSSGLEPSTTYIIKSAFKAIFLAFSTPIFSTISSVLRIPAVSIRFKVIPPILICSSNASLVVPSISVTIALSSFARAFNRLDFPALVFPKITVLIPSRIIRPFSAFFTRLSTIFTQLSTSFLTLST